MSRILFISPWFPYPTNNGSKQRISNLLRGLATHHEIDLISFAAPADLPSLQEESIRPLCRRLQIIPQKLYNPRSIKALAGFFNRTPRYLVDIWSPQMQKAIIQSVGHDKPDLVLASEISTGIYWQTFNGLPALLDDLEIAIQETRIATAPTPLHSLRRRLTRFKQRHFLHTLLTHYRACTVVSALERQLVGELVPAGTRIEIIPNCINLEEYFKIQKDPIPDTLIFTGSFRYFANHDAMTWFLSEVYPIIQKNKPGVQLSITGDHANLPLPFATNLTLTGFVNDIRPLVANASVSLVPIRLGSGTRIKILEAMALGTPVVSTTKGAEGLDVIPGKHLLIADTPADFAQAVLRLLDNRILCKHLVKHAYRLVSEKYDWNAMLPRYLSLIEETVSESG